MTILIVLAIFLLPLLLLITKIKQNGAHNKRKPNHNLPPGPPKLPIIGNLHQLGKNPHRALSQLSTKHGPLMYMQMGEVPTMVVSSSKMAKEFLKTHDLEACSRPAMTSLKKFSYDCSDVAFAPYNAQWRELRKICIERLLSPKKVESFARVRDEEVQRMITNISSHNNITVNLSELLFSLSNSITCVVSFGRTYNVKLDGSSGFFGILREMQDLLGSLFVGDYLPWARWVDVISGQHARMEKNFRELDAFYEELIRWHLETVRDEEDVVDVLLRIKKEQTHLTDKHIKGVLMNILVAGTDTSAATLEFAMAELTRNPRVMERAQDEVRRTVGINKGKVEESDIPQLIYLKAVVKETLRLHPVTPLLLFRETMQHFLVDRYDIMPKTRVIVNAWAIGREKESWEMPDEFNPERFMQRGCNIDFRGHDFQLVPFGAGRRICPGLNFAVSTVELALANLLYTFDWSVACGNKGRESIDMSEAVGITVHLKSPLNLIATKHRQT